MPVKQKTDQTPAAMLKTIMAKNGVIASVLADAIGIAKPTMYSFLAGKTGVTVAMAFRLSRYFGTTPEYWINAQMKQDIEKAGNDKALQAKLKGIAPLKKTGK